jgi:hypothetical protein
VTADLHYITAEPGTSTGLIHVIGSPAFQCTLFLSTSPQAVAPGVKFLTFHPGASRLACIDAKDTLHVWNLGPGGIDDHRNLPHKDVTVSLYGNVTYVRWLPEDPSAIMMT